MMGNAISAETRSPVMSEPDRYPNARAIEGSAVEGGIDLDPMETNNLWPRKIRTKITIFVPRLSL
jgi:hypothetical protein